MFEQIPAHTVYNTIEQNQVQHLSTKHSSGFDSLNAKSYFRHKWMQSLLIADLIIHGHLAVACWQTLAYTDSKLISL